MGNMASTVVIVVIRIGLIRVAPASISALSSSISPRFWFAASTNRMPLFTTVPESIRKPIRETMLIFRFRSHRSPKEPIRLKGIVVITMTE